MQRHERVLRRSVLKAGGIVGAASFAGCLDDNDVDPEAWEDVEEFYFEGRIEAWTGIEPNVIEGEDNPTITLIDGQEYDFRWVNADGARHNMEIRDDDNEIIDDYVSDDVEDEGEEATIEGVVATEEMDVYICTYHESTQVGDIEVQTE